MKLFKRLSDSEKPALILLKDIYPKEVKFGLKYTTTIKQRSKITVQHTVAVKGKRNRFQYLETKLICIQN